MTLKGKVAIVTGGNSGIGKAVVLGLAEAGANIVIDYVADEQATEDLEKQVVALGDQAIGVEADVSKVEDLERLIAAAVEAFGRLDIMVNNAGIETRTSVLDTTEAQYDKVMAINLKSAFFGTQLAAKQMIAQGGGGRIINITSVHEDWPMPGNTPYCLSKGGMRMLTRTAGVELGPHGITVVGVGPGAVATPINTSTMDDPTKMATLDAAIPLGRMAAAGGDRQRRRLPRRRRRQLPHGDDDLRRRRHHALQPRAVAVARSSSRAVRATPGGRRRSRLRRPPRHPAPRRAGPSTSPWSTAATTTCSSRCCTRWRRACCRRARSRRRSATSCGVTSNVRVELAEVTGFDLDRRVVHATSAGACTTSSSPTTASSSPPAPGSRTSGTTSWPATRRA